MSSDRFSSTLAGNGSASTGVGTDISGSGEGCECGDGGDEGNDNVDDVFVLVADTGQGGSIKARVALFVNAISNSVSYNQVKGLFTQFGSQVNVFVQHFRRPDRHFRFAFVRFSSWKASSTTINCLDGFRMGNASLFLSLDKPPSKNVMDFGATNVSAHCVATGNRVLVLVLLLGGRRIFRRRCASLRMW